MLNPNRELYAVGGGGWGGWGVEPAELLKVSQVINEVITRATGRRS